MQVQITGKNTEVTPAIRNYVEKKLKRIIATTDKISHIHFTFHIDNLTQIVEANITVPGSQIHAEADSTDMYESIDKLIDKITRQLKKYKEKQIGR